MTTGRKNTYEMGLGLKANTLIYTIEGDKVIVRDGSYNYSDDYAKTYSIKDLVDEYYSNPTDKARVNKFAAKAHFTDWASLYN